MGGGKGIGVLKYEENEVNILFLSGYFAENRQQNQPSYSSSQEHKCHFYPVSKLKIRID